VRVAEPRRTFTHFFLEGSQRSENMKIEGACVALHMCYSRLPTRMRLPVRSVACSALLSEPGRPLRTQRACLPRQMMRDQSGARGRAAPGALSRT
jgi:hypothetical protein